MVDPNTRQGKRTPVTLKIKFKSETLDQFIERYAVDVSQGGIFIRTKEPLAVGTQMKFEFQLRDASPLIAGEGTVVWTRENDPSRPAIAPGMGVRFDRLADGSQGILERILTEKAKQAPQRPASDTAKPPLFTDAPTRVAPAPIQEALLGKDNGRGRRNMEDVHADSHTPLPKPMPFHSDADEFPDEAFEEATKVRALDELIAQTAESDNRSEPPTLRSEPPPQVREPLPQMRPEARAEARIEHTSRRVNGRGDTTVADPDPDRAEQSRPTVLPLHAEPQEVPDLPNPPELARPQSRQFDTPPPPRSESLPPSLPDALAKTRLGVEPARARIAPSTPPPPLAPMLGEIPPVPSGMRAVAHEQTEPARMPELKSRSVAPLLILIFLAVAAAGAAVWFLVLRSQVSESRDRGNATPAVGSAGSAAVAASGGSGAAHAAAPTQPPPPTGAAATGAPPPPAGSGAAPAETGAAKAEIVETEIAASVDGALVEVTGTDQRGPTPFIAKLEKGKSYKARITARGFAATEIDLQGGAPKQTLKLVPKPRLITVSSDPPGALISVDGAPTGKLTPSEIELTPAQAAKKSVRVELRKKGFRALASTVDLAKYTDGDTQMTARLDEKLAVAPLVARPPAGARPANPPAGSDTDSGTGSADTTAAPSGGSSQGGDSSTAPPPPPPAPPPAPPAAPSGAGSTGGSSEPEPQFNKQ